MEPIDLLNIKQRFIRYCRSFTSGDEEDRKAFALKEQHSLNVSANMLSIAGTVLQNRNMLLIAEVIGLLHDIGRFPQYAQYRTFRDSDSLNHGRLGAEVIKDSNVLGPLLPDERELILDAVRFHNAYVEGQSNSPVGAKRIPQLGPN